MIAEDIRAIVAAVLEEDAARRAAAGRQMTPEAIREVVSAVLEEESVTGRIVPNCSDG